MEFYPCPSLRRYVTYVAGSDVTASSTMASIQQLDPKLAAGPSLSRTDGNVGLSEAVPTASGPPLSQPEWSAETMDSSRHLSGSDPRLFPGVVSRDQRSGSRTIAQPDEVAIDTEESGSENDC